MLSNGFRRQSTSCLLIHSGATVPPYLKLTVRSLQIVDPQVHGARHIQDLGFGDSVSPVQSSMFLMHILNWECIRSIFFLFTCSKIQRYQRQSSRKRVLPTFSHLFSFNLIFFQGWISVRTVCFFVQVRGCIF